MSAPRLWVWIGSSDDKLDLLRYVHATKDDILKQPVVEEEIQRRIYNEKISYDIDINNLVGEVRHQRKRAEKAEMELQMKGACDFCASADAEMRRAREAKSKAENMELRAFADLDEAIVALRNLVLIIHLYLPEQHQRLQEIQDTIRLARKLIADDEKREIRYANSMEYVGSR